MHTKNEQGSIWRKWDLHFHTPSSYDYKNKSVTNEEIISILEKNNTEVVAITDHHIIDVDRIEELKRIGEGRVTILPGIEFRSDIVLNDSLHFIGIFPEGIDIKAVWDNLRVKLNINIDQVYSKTEEANMSYSLKETSKLIHELGGLVSVHAGTKSNSFENITNKFKHTQEFKRKILLEGYVDILEVGKVADIADYNDIVFPFIGQTLPIIICSDNHNINDYLIKENLWIKGDSTFKTLKQIFNQPDRIYIGNKPLGKQIVEENPTKYIERLKINKKADSTFNEVWFNNIDIPINSGLVAIIGNKGNGKSALTDILGLCGNTHNSSGFSFLSNSKFKKNKSEKAENYEALLVWHNGKEVLCSLNSDIDIQQEERIKYIPQSHLERLCDSIEESDFERELKQIIFSHIPQHERLGKNDLDELLSHTTQIIRNDIEKLKGELSIVNSEILFLEAKENPYYKKKLEENLKIKEEELLAHQNSKPVHQEPPINKNNTESEKITLLREEYQTIISSQNAANEEIGTLNKEIAILSQRIQSILSLKGEIEQQIFENKEILSNFSIDIASIIKFNIDTYQIDKLLEIKKTEISNLYEIWKSDGEKILKKKQVQAELAEIQSKLDQPARQYQIYLTELENWENVAKEILGGLEIEGSIVNINSSIAYINNNLRSDLGEKYATRKNLIKSIFGKKKEIIEIYTKLYKSVTDFIEQHESLMSSYKISFNTLFKENDLYKKFQSMINFSSIGSFHNINEGMAKITDLFESNKFETEDDADKFVNDILFNLKYDNRKGNKTFLDIKTQLKGGYSPVDMYNFISGLDYLAPAYELRLSDKNVTTLSPGERGALLLIFYLILDNNNIPLIIDQPEENLDNQSVYNILVPFIKKAKSKRQVIIVTHNPNLAVVCDADQIMYIKIDKEDKNTVYIKTGGLENPEISSKIVEILEGTYPGFSTRTNTYNLHGN